MDGQTHVFLPSALVGEVVSFMSRPFYHQYPLDRMLDGPQSRFWTM
jgi:hypothetical protein